MLVAPLALLAPLMFIDMGLFLVVVVPVGFALTAAWMLAPGVTWTPVQAVGGNGAEAVAEAVMVIADVSAKVPPDWVAITRYVPAVCPAVYSSEETVPPVATAVTVTGVVEPSLILPDAVNCCFAPGASEIDAGVRTTPWRTGLGAGDPLAALSHLWT